MLPWIKRLYDIRTRPLANQPNYENYSCIQESRSLMVDGRISYSRVSMPQGSHLWYSFQLFSHPSRSVFHIIRIATVMSLFPQYIKHSYDNLSCYISPVPNMGPSMQLGKVSVENIRSPSTIVLDDKSFLVGCWWSLMVTLSCYPAADMWNVTAPDSPHQAGSGSGRKPRSRLHRVTTVVNQLYFMDRYYNTLSS